MVFKILKARSQSAFFSDHDYGVFFIAENGLLRRMKVFTPWRFLLVTPASQINSCHTNSV